MATNSKTGLVDHLTLVFNGIKIKQRPTDGYMDGTAMCKTNGVKNITHWTNNQGTKDLEAELSKVIKSDTTAIEITRGPKGRTFVHPFLAIHLAMWISPAFAVTVITWTYCFLSMVRI